MVKVENVNNMKVTAKGILKEVTSDGIMIEDSKTGELDTVKFEDILKMVDKEISISISNKEIQE